MAELADLLGKVIRLNRADSTINGIFFNPLFAERMPDLLPSLSEAGFSFGTSEHELFDANIVAARLEAPNGKSLDLGEVAVTPEGDIEPSGLVRITRLLGFVSENE